LVPKRKDTRAVITSAPNIHINTLATKDVPVKVFSLVNTFGSE
jgi:hypothetical protein